MPSDGSSLISSGFRSVAMTSAPSRAKASAVALPIPAPAAVRNARLPFILSMNPCLRSLLLLWPAKAEHPVEGHPPVRHAQRDAVRTRCEEDEPDRIVRNGR